MPEQFGFMCNLFGVRATTAAAAISAVTTVFADQIGAPIEVMTLDYRTERHVVVPWPEGSKLLDRLPGARELLFCYHYAPSEVPERIVVSYRDMPGGATVGASFGNMSMAEHPADIVAAIVQLRHAGMTMATNCVVCAGGEVEGCRDAATPTDAVFEILSGKALAHWFACDIASLQVARVHHDISDGFSIVFIEGSTVVLART